MSTFDAFRYYLAILILLTGPGSALFWFPIHPFAPFWRRVGWGWAYAAGFGTFALAGLTAWTWRRPLLAVEFGVHPVLVTLGILLIATAAVMRRIWHRQLSIRTLFGVPELVPRSHPGPLLTEGAYARVRHPRYLEVLVGFLGYALLANYLAAYLVCVFLAVTFLFLIRIEERELVARFGGAYEAYRERVPALIPRLGTR